MTPINPYLEIMVLKINFAISDLFPFIFNYWNVCHEMLHLVTHNVQPIIHIATQDVQDSM